MAEITIQQSVPQEEPAVEVVIEKMSTEMDKLFAEMKQMQKNIDRTHTSTKARLADIEAALDRMAAR